MEKPKKPDKSAERRKMTASRDSTRTLRVQRSRQASLHAFMSLPLTSNGSEPSWLGLGLMEQVRKQCVLKEKEVTVKQYFKEKNYSEHPNSN